MTSKKPAAAEPPASDGNAPAEEQKSGAAAPRKLATHPSTAVMVKEALKELDSRKGVSSQAIQNYMKQKYPSVDLVRLKHLVRRALIKGIETGVLVRPAKSTVTTGATGKFRLAPKVKEAKPKTENVDPNVPKAPKGAKKPPKTGASKKKDSANEEEVKSEEESKPPKKSKKEKEAPPPKVAPAKKPKAKKVAEVEDEEGASNAAKPEATGKRSQRKAAKAVSDAPADKAVSDAPVAKATGKRGKKNAE